MFWVGKRPRGRFPVDRRNRERLLAVLDELHVYRSLTAGVAGVGLLVEAHSLALAQLLKGAGGYRRMVEKEISRGARCSVQSDEAEPSVFANGLDRSCCHDCF